VHVGVHIVAVVAPAHAGRVAIVITIEGVRETDARTAVAAFVRRARIGVRAVGGGRTGAARLTAPPDVTG
jgi:transcriptional regulator GlxA family with amidase domain